MSLERIKELLALMDEHGLAELELAEGEFKVRLKKNTGPELVAMPAIAPVMNAAPPVAAGAEPTAAAAEDAGLVPIKSPIVGTFYHAPTPEADPFVKEGDRVGKDSVVCIVEAMKIMNEVQAGLSGTIEKILVENGEPVEYGQPLFMVRP